MSSRSYWSRLSRGWPRIAKRILARWCTCFTVSQAALPTSRLVGNFGYPKTEEYYLIVQDKCNRGRRAGLIPFSSIRDDGVSRLGGYDGGYESPEDYHRTHEEISNFYEHSWHATQPAHVAVLCEAAGMAPMLSNVADEYRVEVIASSGFNSLTTKYELFSEAASRWQDFRPKHDPVTSR